MAVACKPDPFQGFTGRISIETDVLFAQQHPGVRLLGNGPIAHILFERQHPEFIYACISDEHALGTTVLEWIQGTSHQPKLGPGQAVVCYYGITDDALETLVCPCVVV